MRYIKTTFTFSSVSHRSSALVGFDSEEDRDYAFMNAYGTFLANQPLVVNIAYSPHPPEDEFEMRLQLQEGIPPLEEGIPPLEEGILPLEEGIPPLEEEDFHNFVVTVPSASGWLLPSSQALLVFLSVLDFL